MQEQNRHPTYSPGGVDMRGVTIYRIRSVLMSPTAQKKAVQIELHNSTGGWYVGALEWYLWIGDSKFMRSKCAEDSGQLSNVACFVLSMEEWEKLKQGEPVILTWGDSSETRDETLPITNLNKKLLDEKPKK